MELVTQRLIGFVQFRIANEKWLDMMFDKIVIRHSKSESMLPVFHFTVIPSTKFLTNALMAHIFFSNYRKFMVNEKEHGPIVE